MPARPYDVDDSGLRVRVRLTPRSGRDAVEGAEILSDGQAVLKVRVRAVPEKGAANAALEALLARALGVPKSAVLVISGGTSRLKTVKVLGDTVRLAKAMESLLCG